jgi:hypothetical protein
MELPFLKELHKSRPVESVRIRAAGDRLHWNSAAVSALESTLNTGVPIRDWVYFLVDLGDKSGSVITFYHPKNTDIYVVVGSIFENEDWRRQYRALTKQKPKRMKSYDAWVDPDSCVVPVVNPSGKLRLVHAVEK